MNTSTLGAADMSIHGRRTELPVTQRDIRDLQQVLGAGELARFSMDRATSVVFDWSLSDWERRFGSRLINTHTLTKEALERVNKAVASTPAGQSISQSASETSRDMQKPQERFAVTGVPISKLIAEMQRYKSESLEPTWDRDVVDPAEIFRTIEKLNAYGVVNTRTLPGFEFEYPEAYRAWLTTFSFLWFGLSQGGLHHDPFDNTLIQLHGTKKVLIYPPQMTDLIDGAKYVSQTPLAPSTITRHKYLAYLPYHVVELRPGDGLMIPARAYHGPYATSHDSISLNTFLIPHLRRGPFPYERSLRLRPLHLGALMASRVLFTLTGRKWRRAGPYEFV